MVLSVMTNPVTSEVRASGTMTYQPVSAIAVQAARTVLDILAGHSADPRARYEGTAPIHPTESVRWALSANLRTRSIMHDHDRVTLSTDCVASACTGVKGADFDLGPRRTLRPSSRSRQSLEN